MPRSRASGYFESNGEEKATGAERDIFMLRKRGLVAFSYFREIPWKLKSQEEERSSGERSATFDPATPPASPLQSTYAPLPLKEDTHKACDVAQHCQNLQED